MDSDTYYSVLITEIIQLTTQLEKTSTSYY